MGPNLFLLKCDMQSPYGACKVEYAIYIFYKFDIRINVDMREGRERNTFIDDMFI